MTLPQTARYSLDTSALITAWVRNYPPDVFVPVWEHRETLIHSGVVIASLEVLNELEKQDMPNYKFHLPQEKKEV